MSSTMRLRTRVQTPKRFENHDYNSSATNTSTKPAFPKLLKEQTMSFDPNLPPAAFPSLTQSHPPNGGTDRIVDNLAEPADADMMDIDGPLDETSHPLVRPQGDLDTQILSATSSSGMLDQLLFERSFLDDAETSDEEDGNQKGRAQRVVANGARSVCWTQLPPSLQVEIFENLCDSHYYQATSDILGLGADELYDVVKHISARQRQIAAEYQGVQELQQAQLRAVLRKDHSSRLRTDSWRDHVGYTRRHLPHITARYDYHICNAADLELARVFLIERGTDTSVLGHWGSHEKDDGVADWVQTQAMQITERREGVDPGYTSDDDEQGSRHVSKTVVLMPPRGALSDISNSVRRGVNCPALLSHKRLGSLLAPQPDNIRDIGLADGLAVLHIPRSAMSLRPRGSGLKTGGGVIEDSDLYEDENVGLVTRTPPRLKVNPPKPSRDQEDIDVHTVSTSAGTRAITLKITPQRLEQVQKSTSSNARPSTLGSTDSLNSPATPSTLAPVKPTPKHTIARLKPSMPAVWSPLTWRDQDKLSVFSLELLERQCSVAGLRSPPTFQELPVQPAERPTLPPPKRLKFNPPPDTMYSHSSDDTHMQSSEGSGQVQRKGSALSQEAPPWSHITLRSRSLPRPSSKKAFQEDELQSHNLPSAGSSDLARQPTTVNNVTSMVPTAPQTPQHANSLYVKPSVFEDGSPLPGFELGKLTASTQLLDARINEQASAKTHLGPFPQTPSALPNDAGASSRGSISGLTLPTDSLRIYESSLFTDLPSSPLSSPKQLNNSLAGASLATPATPKKSNLVPPSVSPGEQSGIDILFSFQQKTHAQGENFEDQVPESVSSASVPSSKEQAQTEEDASPSGGQEPSAKKASEALLAATVSLHESSDVKLGKDGRSRPRKYVKSEKRIQGEATNAIVRASPRKSRVMGKKRTNEGQRTDTKGHAPAQTATHESPDTQAASSIEKPLNVGKQVGTSGPLDGKQKVLTTNAHNFLEDLPHLKKGRNELSDVVRSVKQKASEPGDGKASKVAKNAADDEPDGEDGTADISTVYRKIATPKGKKDVVDRSKVAVQGNPSAMTKRGRIGKSALTNMASNRKSISRPPTIKTSGKSVSGEEPTPKPDVAPGHDKKTAPVKNATTKKGGAENQHYRHRLRR